ncbi:N-acetylmuramoyl-L-alanine amidase [Ectothiorhodospira mobilis]|uniref:N-acetylmuramoyl-L-alanine amidase n=1 Tax=Ectothiorhodospira mobilis TaxID=195064 RepID=UPI001903E27D|nr:N-acetylmuramoyl-L-alanine amidase [Ectothiorhodospira mobilis]MBK1691157.1 N-acetylmuramoyl-L-alanine amidase [Ectothiorhodospira mobilis]
MEDRRFVGGRAVAADDHDFIRRRLLRALLYTSGALVVSPWSGWVRAGSGTRVQALRSSANGEVMRLVFDLSGPVEHALFTLSDPHRVVIDLRDARLTGDLDLKASGDGLLRRIRHAPRNGDDLRVVLDLSRPAHPRSFLLRPARDSGHRLVIDLRRDGEGGQKAPAVGESVPRSRDVIVAIDAGHGGKDPGAIGPGGTYEKDVVLAIARRLEALVAAEPGMKPVMTRTGDYFLPLRERIRTARARHADVFLSIHADAVPQRSVRGSSVYMLSQRGASSEAARFLAQRENAVDARLGAVPISDKDDVLASVLLDLSQTATLEASNTLAEELLQQLARVGHVHRSTVERAGFAVLKAPDVPSVLVETAFISNPQEERRLRTEEFQRNTARALLAGLRDYFSVHAPPGTLLAEAGGDRHVIRRGETLSAIADRYQVPLSHLRRHNNLDGDLIRVGQVLEIPRRGG